MADRLDEEKLEILRGWGSGLVGDDRDELRAAGRAILILIEEIERLQVDVWRGELAARASAREAAQPSGGREEATQRVAAALRPRLSGT